MKFTPFNLRENNRIMGYINWIMPGIMNARITKEKQYRYQCIPLMYYLTSLRLREIRDEILN